MICDDERYMARALQLARFGYGHVSPNPMVGAVIVADGRIIGEGWHRCFGQAHAEVNAVASVCDADKPLLTSATIYVTLEPCSHFGKTPPCSDLILRTGIPRIVIGMQDPFPKVAGGGIARLRDAGRTVEIGILEKECRDLNRRFITAHTLHRPFIALKWAQTADGAVGLMKDGKPLPLQISTPLTKIWMHRYRAGFDAIMVGTATANSDNPRLDVRLWPGNSPRPVTFDIHGNLKPGLHIEANPRSIILRHDRPLEEAVASLYTDHGITSLLVEGGPRLQQSFIDRDLYDEIRIETSPTPSSSTSSVSDFSSALPTFPIPTPHLPKQ